jgi:hypothetical protein
MSKISLAPDASGTGIFTIASPGTSTNRTLTLPDATGTVVISGTTPSLNGITFPATQVASADANTLDDYEEGTWTPALSTTSGSISFSSVGGAYTKIGRLVYVRASFSGTATISSPTGDLKLTSLPFTVQSGLPDADQITVTENGIILYREATKIIEDGVELTKTYHRTSLTPGQDLTGQPAQVVAIANTVWTAEVIAAYQAMLAEQANRVG